MTAGQADETWTIGQAVDWLNGGGVDFHFTRKSVRQMVKDPNCQIRAISGGMTPDGDRRWFRVLASTVRAERDRLLAEVAEAGVQDPDFRG